MNIIQRFSAPTPSFFRKLRNVALVLTAVSGSLLAAPVVLPALVVQLASYLAVAGSVAMAVSQATTEEGATNQPGDYAP